MGKVWKDKMFACQSQSKGHWIDRSVVLQVLSLNRSPNPIEKTLTSNKIVLLLPFSEARWSFGPWCRGDPGAHSCQKRHGFSLASTENVKWARNEEWQKFEDQPREPPVSSSQSVYSSAPTSASARQPGSSKNEAQSSVEPFWNNIRLCVIGLCTILEDHSR